MRLLVSGGCGFVGSNFVRYVLQHYGPEMITNVDALTTGRLVNLDGVAETFGERYEFLHAEIADEDKIEAVLLKHQFYAVIHFAAESCGAAETAVLIERARRHGVRRFLLVSKRSADRALAAVEGCALAAWRDQGQEIVIVRASNSFGPFQSPVGFIPHVILAVLSSESPTLPGDGSATRDWLHVEDLCAAIFTALLDGVPGAIYDLASESEVRDIDLVHRILEYLGKSREGIEFHPGQPLGESQPGRATPGGQPLPEWKPRRPFDQSLRETIEWYVRNREWWEPLLTR